MKAVLFDLDGTLVDTAPDLARAANCVREEAGLPPLPVERYRPVASAGARGLLKVALDIDSGDPDYGRRRDHFLEHYRRGLSAESRLFAGLDHALSALEDAGILWGVVTNKPQWLAEPLLRDLSLLSRMACLVGVVDGLRPKPAPDPLLRACAQLALDPAHCLYVGDDRRDVDAARAAGMPVVAAAWGYVSEEDPPATWAADAVLRTPAELAAYGRG